MVGALSDAPVPSFRTTWYDDAKRRRWRDVAGTSTSHESEPSVPPSPPQATNLTASAIVSSSRTLPAVENESSVVCEITTEMSPFGEASRAAAAAASSRGVAKAVSSSAEGSIDTVMARVNCAGG